MVSCRCTSRMTREFRWASRRAILCVRMAFSICWRRIGCSAENIMNIQNKSLMDIIASYWGEASWPSCGREAEDAFVGVVTAGVASRAGKQRSEHEPSKEATDVRPPCDARSTGGQKQL